VYELWGNEGARQGFNKNRKIDEPWEDCSSGMDPSTRGTLESIGDRARGRMERTCSACGHQAEFLDGAACPECGHVAEVGDLFEDLGDFGDLGTGDFIPLPGQGVTAVVPAPDEATDQALAALLAEDDAEQDEDESLDFDLDLIALPGSGEQPDESAQAKEPVLGDADYAEPLPGAESGLGPVGLVLDPVADPVADGLMGAESESESEPELEPEPSNGDGFLDDLFAEEASEPEQTKTIDDPFAGMMNEDSAAVDGSSLGGDDDLLELLGGDLDEFLNEPKEESYSVQMVSGEVLGPYLTSQVEQMLRSGMLLGNESVSTDNENWVRLTEHDSFKALITREVAPAEREAPVFVVDEPTGVEEHLPELVGVIETESEQSGAVRRGGTRVSSVGATGRLKLAAVVGGALVLVGFAVFQLGWFNTNETAPVVTGRSGVARGGSNLAKIENLLKKDRLTDIARRATRLEPIAERQEPIDLNARLALARLYCDLGTRFGMAGSGMKMGGLITALSANKILGNAIDIVRACSALHQGKLPQANNYLNRHIKAMDIEALLVGMLVAGSQKDVDVVTQRYDLAKEAGTKKHGETYQARINFSAGRAYEAAEAFEKSYAAFVAVTDQDSTRADAWLGQARVKWALLDEGDDEESLLAPIEEALFRAEREIELLGTQKRWAAEVYQTLGEVQLRRSDYRAAARRMESALKYLPKDTKLLARIARTLRLGGSFDGSMKYWERILQVDPHSEVGIVGLADVFIQTAAYERGTVRVSELISGKRATPAMVFWHAELSWLMGDRARASRLYEEVLKADPEFVRAQVALARIDVEEGRLDAATRRLKSARSIEPHNPWIYIGFGDYFKTQKNYEMAEAEYRSAIRNAPREARAHYLLAKVLLLQDRQSEALESAQAALDLEERNPKYMVERAKILGKLGRHEEAENIMKRAIRMMPEEDGFYVQLAQALIGRERLKEAQGYLRTAAGLDRENPNIPYLQGWTYVKSDQNKALGFLRTADQLRPKHAKTLLAIGETHYRAHSLKDAVDSLSESLQADSSSAEAREWRARAYRDRGQYPEAILDLEHALKIRGNTANLHFEIGEVYYRWQGAKQLRKAIRAYNRAVALQKDLGQAYCRIAEIQIDRQKLPLAYRAAKKCVRYSPKSGSGHLSLGMLHKERGKMKLAVQELRTSLRVDPTGEFADRTREELDQLLRYRR
jgi:tetratricopeptide (TPR) repeat protein